MALTTGKIIADFTTQLATKIAVGGTTATLQSATDDDSVALPSGRYFFTIDGDNSQKEHISCTLSGTSLTSIQTVSRQGTETSGVLREHRVGASVKITDFAHIKKLNDLLDGTTGLNSLVPLEYDGAPSITGNNQIATKAYADSVGSGTATLTNKAVIEAGTAGETIAKDQLVYLKVSDGRWWLCDADTASTVDNVVLGLAQGAGTAGAAITNGVLTSGLANLTAFTVTAATKYYASNTAGGISTSVGTTEVTIGVSPSGSTTTFYFAPRFDQQLTENEQDAIAGGSTFGTPSSTNKFITQSYNSSATGLPTIQSFTTQSTTRGDTTTRFDITNPSGTTFRYTYDGTGTDPGITTITLPIGQPVLIESTAMSGANTGYFVVTGSGTNYFEVTNASGVAEVDKLLTGGYLKTITAQTYTKPASLKYVVLEVQGAGAAGAGTNTNASTGGVGGGAGAYSRKLIAAASLGATETLYVGPGGISPSGSPINSKFAGAASIFGSLLTAPGATSSTGGTASGGDLNISGQNGFTQITGTISGSGGDSFFGLGGTPSQSDSSGTAGTGFGSGGSGAYGDGASVAAAGGAGAAGRIIVTEYYS